MRDYIQNLLECMMIRIDESLVQKAKEIRLNISKVSENALKEMIERVERPISQNNPKDCPETAIGGAARIRTGVPRSQVSENDLNSKRNVNLGAFKDFCMVDWQLTESTADFHVRLIKKYLKAIGKGPRAVTQSRIEAIPKAH